MLGSAIECSDGNPLIGRRLQEYEKIVIFDQYLALNTAIVIITRKRSVELWSYFQ